VLFSFSQRFGLDREVALKIGGAFGGGMARMGETCGAVTGAFMVIGLKYGKTKAGDEKAHEKTYERAQEFVRQFKTRNRFIFCRDLLGHDLGTSEGRKVVKEKKLATTLCPKFVQDAVEIIEELLKD
jgi:C_GCAxxG_C_C family probable redox protein